jgi:hypothetical protein
MPASRSHPLIFLAAALLSAKCLANKVEIPLEMNQRFIESLVREQIFTGKNDSVRINDDGTGCQFLELRQPRVSTSGGRVRLRTDAAARAGRRVGERCLLILDWRGQLEFDQRPVVGDDRKSVLLRTESWRALTPDGHTDTVSTTVGRWLEQFLPLDLKQTRISLVEPLNQIKEFLALVTIRDDAARANALLDSLAVDDIAAQNNLVTVTLGLNAPPATAPPQVAEPSLSEAELAQLETRLEAMDAFVTYTIKHLTTSPGAANNMDALFDVLLGLRYELIAIVAEPQRGDQDPARALFINTWGRLTPILHDMAEQQADHESAVRYLTFIGAGDMLRALDRLGPAAGVDISSDGLRRLARILIPSAAGDPLRRDAAVDPELRQSFGFGAPLPPPQNINETSWLDWVVKPALAASTLDASTVKKLNNWVPKTKDMDVYLPMVRDVLRYAVAEQLGAKELDRAFHDVFRKLVITAAWQESCWRQFAVEKDRRVPLRSGSGDLGMMQINPRVWRGFYDQHGLQWDIVYNARAGADILEHYMIKYAVRHGEHKTSGKVENLARSAYAAYNGGPRQYDRYRRKDAPAHGKQVDTLFYEKFRAVNTGDDLAVKACYRG